MRSRLERNWARFFDHVGIHYEYEPKTFSTPLGGYLPDFFVPALDTWIEIKPLYPEPGELAKIQSVSDQSEQRAVVLAGFPVASESGDPNDSTAWIEAGLVLIRPHAAPIRMDMNTMLAKLPMTARHAVENGFRATGKDRRGRWHTIHDALADVILQLDPA